MKRRAALIGSLAVLMAASRARAEIEVDLQLVLAVDVSRSIDEVEAELQRRGYVEALTLADGRQVAGDLGTAGIFATYPQPFLSTWGEGVAIWPNLTLNHFRELMHYPNLVRGIVNTLLTASVGGALSVGFYALANLALHRWRSRWTSLMDYLVLVPRAMLSKLCVTVGGRPLACRLLPGSMACATRHA